jgi:hypothetical protein
LIEGSRKVERPRLKWLEDVENDLRELIVKRLRQIIEKKLLFVKGVKVLGASTARNKISRLYIIQCIISEHDKERRKPVISKC